MKKFFSPFVILAILLTSNISVFANTNTISNNLAIMSVSEGEFIRTPRFMYTKEKTVVKKYKSQSDIPRSISYEEYHDVFGRGTGTLYLDSSSSNSGIWTATFSGTLYFSNR